MPVLRHAKKLLSEKGIIFNEVNVEKDPAQMQKLINTTGQMGVPQTEINGEWIIGFDPNSIMATLRK